MTNNKNFFNSISAVKAFWLGVGTAIIFFCLIGSLSLGYVYTNTATNTEEVAPVLEVNVAEPEEDETEYLDAIELDSIRYSKGTGDYTFIEYTDLECPYCKTFHETVNTVAAEFDGIVAFAVKHFPLTSLHSKAIREAGAAECAGQQGKYYEFIDAVFNVTPSNDKLEDEQLFTIAGELGLDSDKFSACLENEDYKDAVSADAREAILTGGQGTPHSILVDKDGNIITRFKGALPESQLKQALGELTAQE